MRARRAIAGVLICTTAAILLVSGTAAGGLRMGVSPMKILLSLQPGEERRLAINVFNNGDDAIRVVTEIGDWLATRDGNIQLLPTGSHERAASGWVSVDLAEFTVPAHSTQVVRLTVNFPVDVEGSYWTIVFFEAQSGQARNRLGLRTKVRMATTVYLTAEGTEIRDDTLTDMLVEANPEDGTIQLGASLANRGNVHYYPQGWFQILNPKGLVVFEKELPCRVCLPGTETTYLAPWQPEGAGKYTFVVTVDTGQETLLQGIKHFDASDLLPDEALPEQTQITRVK
ncbi:MAG: hypothetical protein KAW17_11745 [Candidatus Eisenbacteria sp.]|nr:hypothetical protein [Candidatus Eisenbacteria bacterium]